jgi:hypothetical protein
MTPQHSNRQFKYIHLVITKTRKLDLTIRHTHVHLSTLYQMDQLRVEIRRKKTNLK